MRSRGGSSGAAIGRTMKRTLSEAATRCTASTSASKRATCSSAIRGAATRSACHQALRQPISGGRAEDGERPSPPRPETEREEGEEAGGRAEQEGDPGMAVRQGEISGDADAEPDRKPQRQLLAFRLGQRLEPRARSRRAAMPSTRFVPPPPLC